MKRRVDEKGERKRGTTQCKSRLYGFSANISLCDLHGHFEFAVNVSMLPTIHNDTCTSSWQWRYS
jgi:hypothetical protein